MLEEDKKLIWRKITYPGVPSNRYLISENGKIYDTLNDRYPSMYEDKDGYYHVTLCRKHLSIHRVVAYEFCLENRDLQLVVDHLDGDKKNNYYKNLEWVTSSENTRRAIEKGLRNTKGENSSTNIYPEELIHDICHLFEQGKSNIEVYKIIRNSKARNTKEIENEDLSLYSLICRLRRKRTWPDVVSQYNYPTSSKSKSVFIPNENKNRFNEDQVHIICKLYINNLSTDEIFDKLNLNISDDNEIRLYKNAIRSITIGRNWTSISKQYFESRFRKTNRNDYSDIINDIELSDMLDKLYPIDVILYNFGITKENDNRLLRRSIMRRIHNYSKLNKISNYKNICMSSKEFEDFESWAAEW